MTKDKEDAETNIDSNGSYWRSFTLFLWPTLLSWKLSLWLGDGLLEGNQEDANADIGCSNVWGLSNNAARMLGVGQGRCVCKCYRCCSYYSSFASPIKPTSLYCVLNHISFLWLTYGCPGTCSFTFRPDHGLLLRMFWVRSTCDCLRRICLDTITFSLYQLFSHPIWVTWIWNELRRGATGGLNFVTRL